MYKRTVAKRKDIDNKLIYDVLDYWISGELQMSGSFSDVVGKIAHGLFKEGNGTRKLYDDKGNFEEFEIYKDGVLQKEE